MILLRLFNRRIFVSLSRRIILMSVRGPTTAILFFACPKKSIQKKRHPKCRFHPARRSVYRGSAEGASQPLRRRAASMPHPFGLISINATVLGAAYGV